MKNFLRSLGLTVVFTFALHTTWAANVGDPAEVNMKIYKVWASPNTSCTNATLVYNDASPVAQDMVSNPTLGSGSIADGTYPCVILKMSDLITGKPAYTSDGGHCTPSTNIAIDVFRSPDTSTCPDGSVINGSGTNASGIEDGPCLFMSTTGSSLNSGWIASSPFPLTSPFVVNGDLTGTFVADFRGKIEDAYGECGIEPPVFGFR